MRLCPSCGDDMDRYMPPASCKCGNTMVDVNGTVSSYISNSTIRYAGLPPVVNATLPTVLIPVPVGKARRPDPRFITISRNNVVCCTLVEQVSTGYRKWVLDRDADKKGMAEAFYDSSDKWTPE